LHLLDLRIRFLNCVVFDAVRRVEGRILLDQLDHLLLESRHFLLERLHLPHHFFFFPLQIRLTLPGRLLQFRILHLHDLNREIQLPVLRCVLRLRPHQRRVLV
jgi:hypothetical protein